MPTWRRRVLGSLIFGLPMFVESGTLEIGEFLATHSGFLVGTHLFALGIVVGILSVADIQDVHIHDPSSE